MVSFGTCFFSSLISFFFSDWCDQEKNNDSVFFLHECSIRVIALLDHTFHCTVIRGALINIYLWALML